MQKRGSLGHLALALSTRVNYERALRYPGRVPFIMVTEFPRSGGNWVRDMLGDALQLPVPRQAVWPATFRSLVHNHDHRVIQGNPVVYVYRDGRDILASHFAKAIVAVTDYKGQVRARTLKFHPSLARAAETGDTQAADIAAFYEEWRARPIGSKVNWGDHITGWFRARPALTQFIRYEDMHERPAEALAAAAGGLNGGKPVPDYVIDFAIRRNSFEAQTGRKPGDAAAGETKRQGIAGAWRRTLPPEIVARFAADFGEALHLAGYPPE